MFLNEKLTQKQSCWASPRNPIQTRQKLELIACPAAFKRSSWLGFTANKAKRQRPDEPLAVTGRHRRVSVSLQMKSCVLRRHEQQQQQKQQVGLQSSETFRVCFSLPEQWGPGQAERGEKSCSEMPSTQHIPSPQELHCVWYLMH